jgi:hypothetical protein
MDRELIAQEPDEDNGNRCPVCGECVEDFDLLTDSQCHHCAAKFRAVFDHD